MTDKKSKIALVQIKINGKLIPLKGFLQNMIGQTIMGMLASLKETGEPREVEIIIKVQ